MTGKAYAFPLEIPKVIRPPRRRAGIGFPDIPQVRRALVLAYKIEALIREGKVENHAMAARWLGVSRARVAQVSGLLCLAPAIQAGILTAAPERLEALAEEDLREIALVADWAEQLKLWDRAMP